MGRIRTIKPEFFKHEGLFEAERETGLPLRLAFAGLWTQCDRDGRFEWRPRRLKTDILPYDDIDFVAVLDGLHAHGFVYRYSVDGHEYGCVPSWNLHQAINTREAESKLPAPDGGVMIDALPSRHIPKDTQRHVRARDGACHQCGSAENLQFDHIVPFSKGGTHDISNLRLLCKDCNLSKGDKYLDNNTCVHMHAHENPVHAQGEREKEREGEKEEEKEEEGKGKNTSNDVLTRARGEAHFETFWNAYPKRCGTNSRAKAAERFALLVKAGADPPTIIAGAMRYAAHCDAEQKTGTEFVQQTTTWLNQRGWETEYGRNSKNRNTLADGFRKLDEVFAEFDRREGIREESGEEDIRVLSGLREDAA